MNLSYFCIRLDLLAVLSSGKVYKTIANSDRSINQSLRFMSMICGSSCAETLNAAKAGSMCRYQSSTHSCVVDAYRILLLIKAKEQIVNISMLRTYSSRRNLVTSLRRPSDHHGRRIITGRRVVPQEQRFV